MKDLDYVYDKFDSLISFLESEVSILSDYDEFLEAKEALDTLHQLSKGCTKKDVEIGKLYRVIDNEMVKYYGVKLGDHCTLFNTLDLYNAWFKNDNWEGDGVWCLSWNMVEEVK